MKLGSTLRSVLSAISLLWLGSLIGAGLAFTTQVILARELSPAGYGVFASALATVTLLAPLAGFGVHAVWLKVFGAEGWQAMRWLPSSFRFILVTSAATMVLLLTWSAWGPHDDATIKLLLWLSPVIFGYLFMESVSSKLMLEERFRLLAFWQMSPHLIRLALIAFISIAADYETIFIAAGVYASAALITIIMGVTSMASMIRGHLILKGHGPLRQSSEDYTLPDAQIKIFDVANQAWPFGLATVFHLIYFQSDIVFVKYIVGNEAAGIYNVALTVMAAIYLLPSVVYQKYLLPKIHRWANHDRNLFYAVYRNGNIAMLALGSLSMITIWAVSCWAVPTLFGANYSDAIESLNILAICGPIVFVASSVGATLVTRNHMARKVRYMGLVALINIALNALLIPYFGAAGAAGATVVSYLILLYLYYSAAQRFVFIKSVP